MKPESKEKERSARDLAAKPDARAKPKILRLRGIFKFELEFIKSGAEFKQNSIKNNFFIVIALGTYCFADTSRNKSFYSRTDDRLATVTIGSRTLAILENSGIFY